MTSQIITLAWRAAFGGATGIAGFGTYKSQTDPVHLFWDLDNTLLCSITPIPTISDLRDDGGTSCDGEDGKPTSKCPVSPSNIVSLLPTAPSLDYFDQIDDDFPYDAETLAPNTRTFWRPGARAALKLCSCFAVIHVYTAAQGTYTANILDALDPDRNLFGKGARIIHRDDYPQIVRNGKDLRVGTDNMQRAILFDDRVKNFEPQNHKNGIPVVPFTPDRVGECKD